MASYRGKWALITGASAGIGANFARAMAEDGVNLVLVARRQDKLEELAGELEAPNGIRTHIICADLAKPEAPLAIVEELAAQKIGIDIVVNNAGFGLPGSYSASPWQDHRDFIELMVTSYAALTHHLLPGMIERGFGRIIQVASVAGLVPGANGHTLYGATKAFLINFAQALSAEYEDKNIHCCALCPGFTYTEFHDVNGTRDKISDLPKFMMMEARPVVDGALRAVENRHVVYVPGMVNKAIVTLARLLPRPWVAAMMRNNSSRIRKGT